MVKRLLVTFVVLLILVACSPMGGETANEESAIADPESRVKVDGAISVAPEPYAAEDAAGPSDRGTTGVNSDARNACLNADEALLAQQVNEYRASLNLPPVALSKSLTLVAQQHAWDSMTNGQAWPPPPPGQSCNMHSWTDRVNPALQDGTWTPVCYTNNHANSDGVTIKPSELAGYPGVGRENSYFGFAMSGGQIIGATPAGALQAWKNSPGHNALLISSGSAQPLAMGVGIKGDYAHLWMGYVTDPAGTPSLCSGQVMPTPTPVPTVMAAAVPPTPAPVATAGARRIPPIIDQHGTVMENGLLRFPFDVQTGQSYVVVVTPAPDFDVAPTFSCQTSGGDVSLTFDEEWEGGAESYTYRAQGDGSCAVGVYGYQDSVGDFNITVRLH